MNPTAPSSASAALACASDESAALGMLVLENEIIADCNERFCSMVGCERAEVLGRTFLDVCPEIQADGAFSRERWQRRWHAARAGLPQWFPWQFRHCAGGRAHGLVDMTVEGAGTSRLIARVHDLTHLQDAGWATPDSLARAQQVLDHSKALIAVKDIECRYVFANRELERAIRTPAEMIIGRRDDEIWPPEIAERFCTNDLEVLRERRAIEFEVTAPVARQLRTFLAFKFPLFGPDGEPYGLCGMATDITERKRTQDALTGAALAVSSAEGPSVFQELVRYLATILEVDAALIATPHESRGPDHMRMHAFFLDGEIRDNFEYPTAGTPCATVVGRTFRLYASRLRELYPHEDDDFASLQLDSYAGYPLSDSSGAPLGLIAVMSRKPMTGSEFIESILKIFAVRAAAELERQRAEETLRRSEASYRAIFESSEDAVFIHDWDTGAVIDVNRRACEIYGYTYEEMKRIRVADISSGEYPYTGADAARWLEEAKSGRTVRGEWHRRNRDGSLHWDEVVLRPAVIAGERRILAFTREITERKHAEHALRQAQKMEALGHLTGGVAHDFNNLLTSIMGYVVLAGDHPHAAADPKLRKYLDQAQLSCVRARDLIQQMLTFSRARRGQPRPVSLAGLVPQALKLFSSAMPSTIDTELRIDRDVPTVMLDPVHLDQILLNLCLNARDAMSGAGTLGVSVQRATPGVHVCAACHRDALGEFVELCVADDGPGVAPEMLDRIFEPFFTTKDVGKGSGMGLASVHGIVHELGGHIVVDAAPGSGARFRVLFPALSGERDIVEAQGGVEPRVALPQLCGRILVVDDEQTVGAFMQDLLESWGLEVSVVTTPSEAGALFGQDAQRFDLVITDQAMPRMTGVELARELRAIRPNLPVILYTGFNEGLPAGGIEGLRGVLTKPIDPHALFGLLQTHLPR